MLTIITLSSTSLNKAKGLSNQILIGPKWSPEARRHPTPACVSVCEVIKRSALSSDAFLVAAILWFYIHDPSKK